MRILITGIAGAVGSYMADYIMDHYPREEIHGIVRSEFSKLTYLASLNGRRIKKKPSINVWDMAQADITHIADIKPELIFHFASWADVKGSFDQPAKFLTNNIFSTLNLFDAVRESGIDPTIVLASTSEVYGKILDPSEVPIKETNEFRPVNPYAVSKATQDHLGWMYFNAYGMKIIRTRTFGYINPRRRGLAITSFAIQIAEIEAGKRKFLKVGNLKSVRTFIDIQDVVRAYWLAAMRCKPGEAYNIGCTLKYTIGNVLYMLIPMSNKRIEVKQDHHRRRPADISNQIPDIAKFREATDWVAEIPLHESLRSLLDSKRRSLAA